ncbi:MAG: MBOAT family protein [Helicobacter sp.]|nr:MBOAT family protein [Helicobacter sp.]
MPSRVSLSIERGGGQNNLLVESLSPTNNSFSLSNPNPLNPTSSKTPTNPKCFLILGIVFNLALLGFFKYTDFFLENFNAFSKILSLDFNIPLPHILLPLAISFFTFQQIAFLVDCYKRIDTQDLQEEGKALNFLDYCLFVCFFPQLIAGPIVHHKEMMPQFHTLFAKGFDSKVWERGAKGIFIFSLGLFKKVVIADSFAKWANAGFAVVEQGGNLNIFESWATSLSYTFQLYFDFSGYCDMAIGLGLFFGIMLPINFDSPYKSLNISEFWRKWHITLGRFLKDYLYIPLGGNQNKKYQDSKSYAILNKIFTLRNLFIVAFLSGIWHGAGFGFILWGSLHGLAMCVHRIYGFILERFQLQSARFLKSKVYQVLCWFVTFNFLNCTWIFFRSENVQGAINLLKGMFGIVWVELPQKIRLPKLLANIDGRNDTLIYIILAFIVCLCFSNSLKRLERFSPNLWNAILTGVFFYYSLIMLASTPYTEFIYFNF